MEIKIINNVNQINIKTKNQIILSNKLNEGEFNIIFKDKKINFLLGIKKNYTILNLKIALSKIIKFTSDKYSELSIKTNKEKEVRAIIQLSKLLLKKYSLKKIKQVKLKKINIITNVSKKIINEEKIIANYNVMAKSLINMPPNIATPEYIFKYTLKNKNNSKLKIKKLDSKKFPLLYAVGKASINKPLMMIMEYNNSKKKPIVLVGKGITFDSGGLGIKSAKNMKNMKSDMSGASAVIHSILALAKLNIKKNIVGIIPLAENSIGSNAYRIDDVIKSYGGKFVEIIHTDAEGRLVLADALELAQEYKPAEIIDIATLTGASIFATGPDIAPIMGNKELIEKLKYASTFSFENFWELPLPKFYENTLNSEIADIKNLNEGLHAGSIIGGLFLKKFVGKNKWMHIDIGMSSWKEKGNFETMPGANAYGMRTLAHYLINEK